MSKRRVSWRRSAAGTVIALGLVASAVSLAAATMLCTKNSPKGGPLRFRAACKSSEIQLGSFDGTTLQLSGINLQVVSGSGTTEGVNGKGNLIVGYNELACVLDATPCTVDANCALNTCDTASALCVLDSSDCTVDAECPKNSCDKSCSLDGESCLITADCVPNNCTANVCDVDGADCTSTACLVNACGPTAVRTGSHNVVVGGPGHSYPSTGGLVAGRRNTIDGLSASVSGGSGNHATGVAASVSGGQANRATGSRSSVGGGRHNETSGKAAAICGGTRNEASGRESVVAAGLNNVATNTDAAVTGGRNNTASGRNACVAGGNSRSATATDDWVAGTLFQDN